MDIRNKNEMSHIDNLKDIKRGLVKARKLIENPENWTQVVYAKKLDGDDTHYLSPDAYQFCAFGAIANSFRYGYGMREKDFLYDSASILLNAASGSLGYESAAILNDGTDHETVLKMFDVAISCRAQPYSQTCPKYTHQSHS